LMNAVNVAPASKEELPLPSECKLSSDQFDTLTQHKFRKEDGYIVGEQILYLNEKNQTKTSVEVKYYKSEHEARLELFGYLTESVLPTELLIQNYFRIENGPGDVCVVINSDRPADVPEHVSLEDYTRKVYFIRRNTAVRVHTFSDDLNAMEIARKVDTILAGSMEQQGKRSPEPR